MSPAKSGGNGGGASGVGSPSDGAVDTTQPSAQGDSAGSTGARAATSSRLGFGAITGGYAGLLWIITPVHVRKMIKGSGKKLQATGETW